MPPAIGCTRLAYKQRVTADKLICDECRMNDARKAQAAVIASLSRPHTLFHEAVLGRTVKRLAFCAHCFASAGVPLALLHEAHLSSAVKRLAVRAHRLALAGLRSTARHVISTARTIRLISSSFVHNSGADAVTDTEASVCGIVQYDTRALHPPQTEEFRPQSDVSQKG
jgi:hypothetical protein